MHGKAAVAMVCSMFASSAAYVAFPSSLVLQFHGEQEIGTALPRNKLTGSSNTAMKCRQRKVIPGNWR